VLEGHQLQLGSERRDERSGAQEGQLLPTWGDGGGEHSIASPIIGHEVTLPHHW
jgi:hypothetical protein